MKIALKISYIKIGMPQNHCNEAASQDMKKQTATPPKRHMQPISNPKNGLHTATSEWL